MRTAITVTLAVTVILALSAGAVGDWMLRVGGAADHQGSKPTGQTQQSSTVSEAQSHYRIALVAVKNNDLPVAEEELRKAADLAPKNALIFYNLAVVQSKRDESKEAAASLRTAMRLGIPPNLKGAVDDLQAELAYKMKKKDEQDQSLRERQALIDSIAWMSGHWQLKIDRELIPSHGYCDVNEDGEYASLDLQLNPNLPILDGTMDYTYFANHHIVLDRKCEKNDKTKTISYKVAVGPRNQFSGPDGTKLTGSEIYMNLQFVSCSGEGCEEYNARDSRFGPVIKRDDGFEFTYRWLPIAQNQYFHR